VQLQFPALTPRIATAYLYRLTLTADLIDPVPQKFTYTRDPADQPYLDLAIETQSNYLVTRDNDLLALGDASSVAGDTLAGMCPNLLILTPTALVKYVRSTLNEGGD